MEHKGPDPGHAPLSRRQFLDPNLRQQSDDFFSQAAASGLQYLDKDTALESVLNRLDQRIDQQFPRSKPKEIKLNRRWYLLAAAITGLAWLGWWAFQPAGTPQSLAAAYLKPFEDVTGEIVRSSGQPETLRKRSMLLYQQGDYSKAVENMTLYLDGHPEDGVLRFYLAQSLLQRGESARALAIFKELEGQLPAADWQDVLKWYSSLAMLQQGDKKGALTGLRTIEDVSYFPVKELMETLGN